MAFRKRNICAVICMTAFLGLLLFTLIGLQSLINDVVLEGVVMTPENVETWGENPGSTKTVTLRNFTFYNFTNPRGFLYRGQKPKLHQVTNFLLQQRFNFTNITYSADNSFVDFNYWLFFTYLAGTKNFDTPVHVLNLAPLSFWSQLENIDIASLAIQGFGGLYTGVVDTIKLQAIGQGVAGQFLANYSSFLSFCKILNIKTERCNFIYNDPLYGLSDPNNYEVWVQFSYYNHKDSEYLLYQYFDFSKIQLDSFDKQFQKWCFAVDSIIDNSYCGGNVCSNTYLALLQIGQSGVTRKPPSGQKSDSICLNSDGNLTQNISCQGFPQIYSFQKYWFPSINKSESFKDIQISQETVYQLYSPHNGTLLNPGNLSRLFNIGQLYDSNKSPQNLKRLIVQTHGQSQFHAVIIWQYVKYMAYEFVLQSKDKGTKQIAGLGGVFSQAIYQSFVQFGDWIIGELLSIIVAEKVGQCQPFILKTIENISANRAKQICFQINAENYRNYIRLIQPCINEIFADKYKEKYNLTDYQFSELCNIGQESIYTAAQQAHAKIAIQYECSAIPSGNRCSRYELALKQFIHSTVTKNPIKSSIKQYQQSLTGHSWNEELQEWQYRHFLKQVYGNENIDTQTYSDFKRLSDLLSFDGLFNGPLVQNLTLITNQTFFEQLFYWKNKQYMMDYIRFITIQIGFGGFTQKRTAQQLLFGYQDQFLKTLKEMDPMLGGDPSIQTLVALNQPNSTLKQAQNVPQSMYTGYSDPMITRVYRSNYKKNYVTYNKTYFDGYSIISQQVSPFKIPLKLAGTDAVQFKPLSTPDDRQYVYIDSLYRVGQLTYNQTVSHFGFDALRYTISYETLASSEEYPPNENYNQFISGFMNLSFLGPPLFASKNHFLGTGQKWLDKIQFYDESGKYPQYQSQYDQTELIIQPKSGATFTATIYLQTSLYLKKDILFHNENLMVPVFTLYRSGNMTEQIANDLLGDLKFALGLSTKLIILSIVGVIFGAACLIGCNMKKKPINKSSLLSSTYENESKPDLKEEVDEEANQNV